jgi:hypothetical protein
LFQLSCKLRLKQSKGKPFSALNLVIYLPRLDIYYFILFIEIYVILSGYGGT